MLTPYLNDAEAETRAHVALALARYPDLASKHLPLIRQALAIEEDTEARDKMLSAVARLQNPLESDSV